MLIFGTLIISLKSSTIILRYFSKFNMFNLFYWDRIVCDEVHEIESMLKGNILHKYIVSLQSNYRWNITGTPFPNNLQSYINLMSYNTNYLEKSCGSDSIVYNNYSTDSLINMGFDSNIIEKSAKATMEFFVDFYQETKPYPIFYGSDADLDWVIAEWRKYGYEAVGNELFEQAVSNARRRIGPTSIMIGSESRFPQTPMILLASKGALSRNNLQMNTIHHVVHGIQGRITGDKSLLLGCWGREGAAQFYAMAIMDRNFRTIGGSDYATERREQSKPILSYWTPKTNLLELSASQWLDKLSSVDGNRFGNQMYCNPDPEIGNFGYGSGALLYERLVGEYGHQKVMDWWYEIRSTSDWKVAFEKVFKLDINDWYKQSAIPYLMKEYQAWK